MAPYHRIGGSPPTWEQAVMAACLVGPPAWASHGTAARLWALRQAPVEDRLHVMTGPERRIRQPGVTAHRSTLLAPDDLSVHRGIPVLSVARTFAEIAGSLGARRLGGSIDDALRRRLLDLERLRACHARLAGPGRRRPRPHHRPPGRRLDDPRVHRRHRRRGAGPRRPLDSGRSCGLRAPQRPESGGRVRVGAGYS